MKTIFFKLYSFASYPFRAYVRNLDLRVQSVLSKSPGRSRVQIVLRASNSVGANLMFQRPTVSCTLCTRANTFPAIYVIYECMIP